ncbi:MAG: cupredoxin domain-containing protein [Dehalococcoidia bacterium]
MLLSSKQLPLLPIVAALLITMSCVPGSTPGTTTSPVQTPSSSQKSVILDVTAQDHKFDSTLITVPAGAAVTLNFHNQDSGVPHNISIYQDLEGGQTRPVFVGQTIAGPANIAYHFTAPSSMGKYFFECDVHPDIMNGVFIVTSP